MNLEVVPGTIHTAGHSTRTLDELANLLREADVRVLADVRRHPASRRHPQFQRAALDAGLAERGIRYFWFGEELGGRKKPILAADESPNRAWKIASFRHYADAMTTEPFVRAVESLETLARDSPTAFLCAERLWWQCHRRLLADLLVVRGWTVIHLREPGKREEHRLPEWARVKDGVLTYPTLL